MGQWCAFPDFSEIKKYTGVYEARNFELFKATLQEHHLGQQAQNFLMASGKLQALCYKAEIEAAFRTPELDGFFLLGINDFPGQGTALVGMLNAFKQEKGYIQKSEIRKFCSPVVPLAELSRFTYKNTDQLNVNFLLSNYGPDTICASPHYWLTDELGQTITEGQLARGCWSSGKCDSLGAISIPLTAIHKATRCLLSLMVGSARNSWDLWVYPQTLKFPSLPDSVRITRSWNHAIQQFLERGGRVLLDLSGQISHGARIKSWFTPVFWNTSWFRMRPPHTLGLYIRRNHPAFNDFPTSFHSNYQWWSLIHGQQVMLIDQFPDSIQPLVQPIDTWFLNRRLAQLLEVRVGKGRLLISTLHLSANNQKPASRQLLYSLMCYIRSDQFNPKVAVSSQTIANLLTNNSNGLPHYATSTGLPNYLKGPKE